MYTLQAMLCSIKIGVFSTILGYETLFRTSLWHMTRPITSRCITRSTDLRVFGPTKFAVLILVVKNKSVLTAHNWQKWKRVFLTCSCHKICRDEAVGLKSYKYTWKITTFVKMWNLGQYLEKLKFGQRLLNWSSNLKILLHMCGTLNLNYLKHITFRFNLIDFQ